MLSLSYQLEALKNEVAEKEDKIQVRAHPPLLGHGNSF